jgi:uncharacterized protein with von Willebrand factor type A (vWA) domain
MTNPNKTLIVLLLDESGSMDYVSNSTIEGTNAFIDKQRELPGEAELKVVKFSSATTLLFPMAPLSDAPKLSHFNYIPRGGTALLDAIGETVDGTGSQLASMKEEDRPGKVIFVIQTDGEENCSRTYTADQVQEKIAHQSKVYGWDFVFLGANQDAIASAKKFGISAGKALSYKGNERGTETMLRTVSSYVESARSLSTVAMAQGGLEALAFSPEDRDANK